MPLDPSSLSGKELWFRAKDLGSGSVTSWPDQSGNGRDLTGSGGTVVAAATPAGGKALSGTSMAYSPASFGLNMTSGGELWVVLRSNGGSSPASWEYGTDSLQSHYTYGGTVYDDFGSTTRRSFVPGIAASGWHVYRVVSNGSNWAAYQNNVLQTSTGSSTMAWKGDPVVLETFSGQVAEILLVRPLTTVEASDLYAYFVAEHGPWLPAQQGRWDANALTGLSDGAAVSTWPDTSGNGYTMSPGAAATYKTSITPTGKPVVRFAGTSWYQSSASAQSGAHTIAGVIRPSGSGVRTITAATGGFRTINVRVNSSGQLELNQNSLGVVGVSPSALSTTDFTVFLITTNNSAWAMRINGVQVASGGGTDWVWSGQRTIGQVGTGGSEPMNGDVAELMTWETILGSTDITEVENYLTAKWIGTPGTPVSTTRSTTWNVAALSTTPVSTTRATTWRVLQAVSRTRSTTWNVASSLVKVQTTRATTWKVLKEVSRTRSTTWNTNDFSIVPVTPATRSTTWNIIQSISTYRTTNWQMTEVPANSPAPALRCVPGTNMGSHIISGATKPGVFEILSQQKCLKDGREYFLNYHNSHAAGIPNPGDPAHNFSGVNACPADNNQSWPQVAPYGEGWISHTTFTRTWGDECNSHYSFGRHNSYELVIAYDKNGEVLWSREFDPTDFGCKLNGPPSPYAGQQDYQDFYLLTGAGTSGRVLILHYFYEYLGMVSGSNRWKSRYEWVTFDGSGNITSRTLAFEITWNDISGLQRTDFIPSWATMKTYKSGTGWIVVGDLHRMAGVLCLDANLNLVGLIGGGADSSTIPAGGSFYGRWAMPSNLDDMRVNIRLIYQTTTPSADRTAEVWSITFDGVTAPSIAKTATYPMTGVGNDWMPCTDGYVMITSWDEGDVVKSPEFWHRFGDPTPVIRPNGENVEAVYTTFNGGDGDGFTTTHVGSMVHLVTDWWPATSTGGFVHTGDDPYNGDRWGEGHYVNRFNYVDWRDGTSGYVDYEFILPVPYTHTTASRPYPHYGDFDLDDAAVFITNPTTNRAFVWQRYYWADKDRYATGLQGEEYGQGFFDTYVIVGYGGPVTPPEPPAAPKVEWFEPVGVGTPDCPMLGVGHHDVFLYDRGGTRMIAKITPTASVRWSRVRDDISEATIVVTMPDPACCLVLGSIGVGRHELVIFRNGERVWEGPITRVGYKASKVEIVAHDICHYLSRTIMRRAYDNRYSKKNSRVGPVTKRAQVILATELARKEALSPPINVLRFMQVRTHPKTTNTSRFTYPYASTVWEELDYMAAKLSLDYTTVGRRLVINDVHDVIGRTEMLTDKDFSDELAITMYGMELATRSAVTDGEGHWAAVGGNDPYYGEVELLNSQYGEGVIPATPGKPTADELKKMMETMTSQAQRNIAGRYPIPTVVRIPDNSRLDPQAPVTIDQLVPGIRIPIRATRTCIVLEQEQKLDRMTVEETQSGESVSIVLSPAPGTTPWDDSSETGGEDD